MQDEKNKPWDFTPGGNDDEAPTFTIPKKRGRPRKKRIEVQAEVEVTEEGPKPFEVTDVAPVEVEVKVVPPTDKPKKHSPRVLAELESGRNALKRVHSTAAETKRGRDILGSRK